MKLPTLFATAFALSTPAAFGHEGGSSEIAGGEACFGYSSNLALLILGAYVHLGK